MRKQKLSKIILLAIGILFANPAFADSPQAGFKGDTGGSSSDPDITDLAGFPSGIGQANKVVGIDAAGTAYERKTLTGTANQVTVTHGVGSVTFATPQDIATGSLPTFAGTILSAALRPSVAAGTTVGTLLLPFSSIYIGGAATNNIQITGTATGSRVFTLPDASITAAGINNANNFSTAQLPSAFGTIDLGSTTRPWKDIYLANGGANYSILRSAALTGNRTHTFPDADSTTVIGTTATANEFLTHITTGGVQTKARPAFTDLSGAISVAQGSASGAAANRVLGINSSNNGTEYKAITAGTNISVTHGANSITIANTASSGIAFGGSGADGATTITTATYSLGGIYKQGTTVTVSGSNTLTLNTIAQTQIFATSTMDINGTITYTAAGNEGGTAPANTSYRSFNGGGPGGGHGPTAGIGTTGTGGAGGGYGGVGGRGGLNAATGFGATGGGTYWWSSSGGSGGASGVSGSGSGTLAAAGQGGSALVCMSVGNMTFGTSSIITVSGGNGGAATTSGGGSGAGSGGGALFASQGTINFQAGASITCSGGTGGASANNCGGGGGGGGGRRIFWAPTITNSGTTAVAGGSGGSGGTSEAGGSGATGVATSIAGTPNLPLMTWLMDTKEGSDYMLALERIHRAMDAIRGKDVSGKEVVYEHKIPQKEIASGAAKNDVGLAAALMTPDGETAGTTCGDELTEAQENAS